MQLKWLGSKLLAIHQFSVAVSVLPIAKPGDTPSDTMSLPVIGNIGCFNPTYFQSIFINIDYSFVQS